MVYVALMAAESLFLGVSAPCHVVKCGCADALYMLVMAPYLKLRAFGADAVVSAAMGLPWVNLLFMGLGTTAFTLWVSWCPF